MEKIMFEEEEIPFGTLARFGLTRDMIEDLPTTELRSIYNGMVSSILPQSLLSATPKWCTSINTYTFAVKIIFNRT